MSEEITVVEAREIQAPSMGSLLGDMSKLKATIAEKAYGIAVSELASWMVAQTAGRDLEKVKEEIKRRAADSRFAEKAIYEKPIGNGKSVIGPSIWLLKQLATLAGHLDIKTSIHSATGVETQLTVRVVDKVSNNKREFDLTVPHTQWKKGYYDKTAKKEVAGRVEPIENPDMVKTVVLSAASKVERNVLTASIDIELVQYAEELCRNKIDTDALALLKNRKACLDYFASKLNVTPSNILNFLELRELDEITTAHIRRLRGIIVAIGEGEINPSDIWPDARAIKSKNDKAEAAVQEKATANLKEVAQAEAEKQAPKPQPSANTAQNTAATGTAQTVPAANTPAQSAPQKDTPEAASGEIEPPKQTAASGASETTQADPVASGAETSTQEAQKTAQAEPAEKPVSPPPISINSAKRGPKF